MNLLYGRDMLEIGTVWREKMIKLSERYDGEYKYVGGWRDEERNGWGLETSTRDNNSFPIIILYYQKPFLCLV